MAPAASTLGPVAVLQLHHVEITDAEWILPQEETTLHDAGNGT
jgi:hypothetical protein